MSYILTCIIIGSVLGFYISLAPYTSYYDELYYRYNNFFVASVISSIISSLILTLLGYNL